MLFYAEVTSSIVGSDVLTPATKDKGETKNALGDEEEKNPIDVSMTTTSFLTTQLSTFEKDDEEDDAGFDSGGNAPTPSVELEGIKAHNFTCVVSVTM